MQEPPISYLPYPVASPNPRYPHPRQRPVTLRSNSNPRRKHICRGERVLGIEVAISTQKEDRHRGYIASTFRKLETIVSMLSILFIHITNVIRDLCRSFCTASSNSYIHRLTIQRHVRLLSKFLSYAR